MSDLFQPGAAPDVTPSSEVGASVLPLQTLAQYIITPAMARRRGFVGDTWPLTFEICAPEGALVQNPTGGYLEVWSAGALVETIEISQSAAGPAATVTVAADYAFTAAGPLEIRCHVHFGEQTFSGRARLYINE